MTGDGHSHFDHEESTSLTPIPDAHRRGLVAVAALAGLSFVTSTLALLYLTFKLVRWHIKTRRKSKAASNSLPGNPFLGDDFRIREPAKPQRKPQVNQFVILILNLLLADIHQAAAFLINAIWARYDIIDVDSPACFAQGWLVSTGDLASSCFITAISAHTYLAVVWDYKPPQWAVHTTMVGLWAFDYLFAILGPAITSNGIEHGAFYVRAAAWCWINIEYETYRLVFHYLFIFICFALTSLLYTLIFLSIRRRAPSPPNSHTHSHGHDKVFLLYPLIYVVCSAPLALGRILTMAGARVPILYFCAAGALIASNGWLDVLLWGVTRQRLLFGGEVDSEDNGLDTFTFMRTPRDRKYGNIVWVEGGAGRGGRSKEGSMESLRRGEREGGIQMDVVTSVVVEGRGVKDERGRYVGGG
ncbi:G protein-coupled glucose receptor regulating Gpa2-domain-containing protein [Cercophora newfieldiana]|uniref:G protein-coupled glucose receptor regulating Gpa2-domain-containing protein n=1 Tax=Cercophora newfieldiana TaxID=92897 RepID=A0AA40CLA9_9PEZI|nr:G protein-coupled glucose receptor regulating Gpa2-domain-containing protein [Cercophora newfieldiana]